mmetsp:Transcript_136528/g.380550  ORF Transcript_136528/g.380550 Transcript_136528/m.380550 type:complete len:214 (-) Transcript_136528:193-834(-)
MRALIQRSQNTRAPRATALRRQYPFALDTESLASALGLRVVRGLQQSKLDPILRMLSTRALRAIVLRSRSPLALNMERLAAVSFAGAVDGLAPSPALHAGVKSPSTSGPRGAERGTSSAAGLLAPTPHPWDPCGPALSAALAKRARPTAPCHCAQHSAALTPHAKPTAGLEQNVQVRGRPLPSVESVTVVHESVSVAMPGVLAPGAKILSSRL